MKVALVGPYPVDPDRIAGGVRAVMLCLARCLASDLAIDLHVITTTKQVDSNRTVVDNGMTVHYIREPDRRVVPNLLSNVNRLRAAIDRVNPDLVHGQSPVGSVAGIKSGRITVHTIHGIPATEVRLAKTLFAGMALRLEGWLSRRAVMGAAHVIATSEYGIRQFGAAVRGKAHRISNPVDNEFFDLKGNEVGCKLLYGGGVRIVKNTLGLVRAFDIVAKSCPQAELLICGKGTDGEYEARVRNYVSSNGLSESVHFLGLVSQADLLRHFGEAAVVCLFSQQEGSPTLIAQAMCAEKPVVVSDAGGAPELVIQGETGFVVDREDEAAFADRSLQLLNEPELRRRMGQRAREVAEQRFRKEVVAAQTKAVYAQALSGQ